MQEKLWGCEAEPTQPLKLNSEWVTRCPRRPILEDPHVFRQLFFLYSNYRRGILPASGSLLEQPAYLLQLFEVMDGALALADKHRHDEAMKKAQKGSRKQGGRARGGTRGSK